MNLMLFLFFSLGCWLFLTFKSHERQSRGFIRKRSWGISGCGGDDEAPAVPVGQDYQPEWATGLPQEQLDWIRKFEGSSLPMPEEYDIASQFFQQQMGYTPEQFAYPMEDIQKALEAQQALQYEQYQKQMNPIFARQGQLDSTYLANTYGDFLKNQQAQALGNTANLLTNQAMQNYDLSKWLPQFQSGAAQNLSNIGSGKANIGQLNLTTPFQTYIPALQDVWGQGLQREDRDYGYAMDQYGAAMKDYEAEQAQQQAMWNAIGTMGGAALGFAIPGVGPMIGASLGGAASGLWGGGGQSTPYYPQQQYYNPFNSREYS